MHDLQNRLGFLVSVARELADLRGDARTAQTLAEQEHALEGSRLQREDAYRESMPDAERRWLRSDGNARSRPAARAASAGSSADSDASGALYALSIGTLILGKNLRCPVGAELCVSSRGSQRSTLASE